MSITDAPELLTELLTEAARTPGGQVGLLRAAQVAEILGRHRDWVHAHATTLGGFQLPGSREWRFSPRGVARGVFGLEEDVTAAQDTGPAPGHRHRGTRRLPYPAAAQLLADRPRHARRDREGAADAPPEQRDD